MEILQLFCDTSGNKTKTASLMNTNILQNFLTQPEQGWVPKDWKSLLVMAKAVKLKTFQTQEIEKE